MLTGKQRRFCATRRMLSMCQHSGMPQHCAALHLPHSLLTCQCVPVLQGSGPAAAVLRPGAGCPCGYEAYCCKCCCCFEEVLRNGPGWVQLEMQMVIQQLQGQQHQGSRTDQHVVRSACACKTRRCLRDVSSGCEKLAYSAAAASTAGKACMCKAVRSWFV